MYNTHKNDRFADIQILRYTLKGWEGLSPRQHLLIFCLSKAALYGRDIICDQNGRYNLLIRKTLETIYLHLPQEEQPEGFQVYLRRVWFSNGIYHHYGCEKFEPGFSEKWFHNALKRVEKYLPQGKDADTLFNELRQIIFDKNYLPKRVDKTDGEDIVKGSACNYYENVSKQEAEHFYQKKRIANKEGQPSWGLNSKLVKDADGTLREETWKEDGLYGASIKKITFWLEKALTFAENEAQKESLRLLIKYYRSGNLYDFDQFSIAWLKDLDGQVDFINGFIEVYGDPIGLKGAWEGFVEYKDLEATRRTQTVSRNAQWFEDHSPVDDRFKKKQVKGVTSNVVCAAMLGGDEYPSSAIGINLPNADWIRAQYGSKSVTIGNLTEAYNKAAHGNGFLDEFVIDDATNAWVDKYGDQCDDLHTDLHECLGHGSGQLLPGTDPNALKAYGNTIEEARADLFGLYYIADEKLLELGLLKDKDAYESQYYTYMMNGLMTQLSRIRSGHKIEEAHMQNRSLITHWALDINPQAAEIVCRDGKHYVRINDYQALRDVFAKELAEIQRIKSEGDYEAARQLVEKYGIKVDKDLHEEVLHRYGKLNLAPYKGFLNPKMILVKDKKENAVDVRLDYSEQYDEQMLRYSKEYATLI